METIGLIAAMAQESRALFRRVKGWRRHNLGKIRGCSFRVGGRDCLLVQSGMGVERAYLAACQVIAAIDPDLLVSFGIAGAVQADLNIGDVVTALNTCDIQVETTRTLHPLAHLSNPAWQAAAQALQPVKLRLWSGTAVTTRGAPTIAPSPEMVHPVLEMETSGILRAAREHGLPLLVLRAISDNPKFPIPVNLEEVMDGSYNLQMGKMVKMLLRRPGLIFKSFPIARNGQKAADAAAIALLAALSQPQPLILS